MELMFSMSNDTFRSLDFDTALTIIKALGFSYIDVAVFEGGTIRQLKPGTEFDEPEKKGKALREKLRKLELKPVDVFMQLPMQEYALNHPDPRRREISGEAFRRAVAYGNALEIRHLTILPGCVFHEDLHASMEIASEELKWRVDYARERGIVLGVEAHVGSIADTPKRASELLRKTPGLTLTLDHSHFIRQGAAQREVDELIPYASHVHLRNAARGSLQTIFEESQIDQIRILHLLEQNGYSGAMTLEFCNDTWENNNRLDTVRETVVLREYLLRRWEEERRMTAQA